MASDNLEVVSEINTFLTPAISVKPIVSKKNRVAKMTISVPKGTVNDTQCQDKEAETNYDKDGDLVLPRKNEDASLEEISVLIEYENATSLEKVGLQVWRGAFLLADFIIHHHEQYIKGKRILELGSGTGLTAIIAALFADHVTATDINDQAILKLLEINATEHNKRFIRSGFQVKALDFLNINWLNELTQTVSDADVILAADVVYHIEITTAFVRTLKKLATTGFKNKDIFIAMEKRYVFTVTDLDTVAPMYGHFLDELEKILNVYPGCLDKIIVNEDGISYRLSMQFLPIDFPQYCAYERNVQLVLLHLRSSVTN